MSSNDEIWSREETAARAHGVFAGDGEKREKEDLLRDQEVGYVAIYNWLMLVRTGRVTFRTNHKTLTGPGNGRITLVFFVRLYIQFFLVYFFTLFY